MAGNSVIVDATTAARDGKKPSELLGECPYNARRLHDELQKRGVESHIICGGLDRPSEDGRTHLTVSTAISDAPAVGTDEYEQMARGVEDAIDGALYEHGCVGHDTSISTEEDR